MPSINSLSVLICTYTRAALLAQTLEALSNPLLTGMSRQAVDYLAA